MTNYIQTQIDDRILQIQLQRGKSNALHLEMIEELRAAFQDAATKKEIEGIVLTGNEGFFSSGLDLITLFQYDEQQMRQFWDAFMLLVEIMLAFPKPYVAAITGHSPAGGCVLALAADHRIMAQGDYIIGLNEVPVGIIVPRAIFDLYRFWIGSANAHRFLLEGKLLSPTAAAEAGLVDDVVDFDKVQTVALKTVKSYRQFEKSAWSSSKLNIRSSLIEGFRKDKEHGIQQVLEQWWKPSTRVLLQTIIENLTKKKQ